MCLVVILLSCIEQDSEMVNPAQIGLVLSDYPKLFERDIDENMPIFATDAEIIEDVESNLIFVGSLDSNAVLKDVCDITDAMWLTNEYPDIGKGMLEILRNPWNGGKTVLLVAKSDEKVIVTECLQSSRVRLDNSIAFSDCIGTAGTFRPLHQVINHIDEGNFSIIASIESPEFSMKNTGNVILTNISIMKDGKIIAQIPKLEVNESINLSLKNINGINCDKEEPTTQNEGWLLITCDQGIEKKLIYWHIVRYAPIPSTQEVLIYKILPLIFLVLITFFGAIFIIRMRSGKK